jgi:hypothetical protein
MTEPMSKQEVTRARAQIFYEDGIDSTIDAFLSAAWAYVASIPREDAKAARAALATAVFTIPDCMGGVSPNDADTGTAFDDMD